MARAPEGSPEPLHRALDDDDAQPVASPLRRLRAALILSRDHCAGGDGEFESRRSVALLLLAALRSRGFARAIDFVRAEAMRSPEICRVAARRARVGLRHRSSLLIIGLVLTLSGCADLELWSTPDQAGRRSTFSERCADPAVVKCVGFDSQAEADPFILAPSGTSVKRGQIVTDVKASGAGSLRFEIPSNTSADTSGAYWQNFSD